MLQRNYLENMLFFIEKVACKLNFPIVIQKRIDSYLYNLVYKKIKCYFEKAENNIDYSKDKQINKVAWIFWWQGIENAPDIVKMCVNSVKNNLGYRVIVLSKDNLREYTNIPEFIYEKLEQGIISKTHFSDIVRFNLLRSNGGLWIDATVLCDKPIDNILEHGFYTSSGKKNTYPYFIEGKWTGFLIGGLSNDPMFQFMDDFFSLYWSKNNLLINYFLIDYAIKYAYDHNIGSLKSYVDNYSWKNNPKLFELQPLLNDTFDKKNYNRLICNTSMFKLSYKKKIVPKKDSYYSHIKNNWLE